MIELVRNWVDEFNAQSVHGSIEMWEAATNTASWQHAFRIPDTGRILLTFRRLVPPLELRRGSVPIFACLADEDGAGFNYILVRQNAEDIYGEWQICKFRTSGFANPRKYPRRPEPFGFESEKEFQKHVSLAEKSMHVYTCEFEEATIDQFATVVREFIRRRRENPEG